MIVGEYSPIGPFVKDYILQLFEQSKVGTADIDICLSLIHPNEYIWKVIS